MKRRTSLAGWLTLVAMAGLAQNALATTDPPTVHDARAMAMGSTAVAHVHNGAAVYHNVAALHEVETVALTANFALVHVGQSAPVEGPNTSLDSEAAIVPQFLIGGAYRVTEQMVLGLAAYTTAGFGAEYKSSAPGFSKLQLGALEVSPALEYSLTKQFALGVGYRISHLMEKSTVHIPVMTPMGVAIVDVTSDLSGTSFAGFHVGAYYRPTPALKLGLAYRSKTTTTLKGKATVMGQDQDQSFDFSFPHAFRLGAAYEAIPNKFSIAVETRYLLHAESNKEIVTTTGGQTTTQPTNWKNSFSVGLGFEYFVAENVPLRAGYMLTTSATADDRPAPFFPPPGLLHSVHAGFGLRFGSVDLDAAAYYAFGRSDVQNPAPMSAFPGRYTLDTLAGGVSVTYHH
jgi:long-subunit fatty acid transport protein